MSCLTLAHLLGDECYKNVPGTKTTVFVARRSAFDALQTVPATPASLAEVGVIATAHTFLAGQGFYKMDVTPGENSVKWEFVGKKGSGSFKGSGRLFVSRADAETNGFSAQAPFDDLIWLIPMKDGRIIQLGSSNNKATVTPMFDSKTDESTDPRGWEYQIEVFEAEPVYYTGTITEHS
jgi:hypothetical protein